MSVDLNEIPKHRHAPAQSRDSADAVYIILVLQFSSLPFAVLFDSIPSVLCHSEC